ncbi:MAG: hypothetical protein MUC96_14335 [Myxococcaceae bacterium]|jgi:hypothetical protein|nr:hypothetical protein [Myxococcaceae bacterium]
MHDSLCCAADVSCAAPLTPFQQLRPGNVEECVCVDSAGLAQGLGVFRAHGVDLPMTYVDGLRLPSDAAGPMQFIDSVWALVGSTFVVMGLVALLGGRAGLQTLGALLVSVLGAFAGLLPSFFIGVAVASAVTSNPFEGADVTFLVTLTGAALVFVLTLASFLRTRRAQWGVALLLMASAAATVAVVAELRGLAVVRAHAELRMAPDLVRAPQTGAP